MRSAALRFSSILPALTLGVPILLAAQAAPQIGVDRCREPKVPIGRLTATGVVRGSLGPKGTVDTATIEVGTATGVSPAGFRSAVVRQLAGCTFKAKPRVSEPLLVLQQLTFDSGKVRIATLVAEGRSFTPIAIAAVQLPAEPAVWPDSLIEEHPRTLECKGFPVGTTTAVTEVMTVEEFERKKREIEERESGSAHFTYVVSPDGTFVPGSSDNIASTSPLIAQRAIRSMQSCRFTPGRIQGLPVATRVVERLEARTRIE